jgi:hypothetical protein
MRVSWRSCTGSLNDAPFTMYYSSLDPQAHYRVRMVYSDLNPHVPVRLEANEGIEVHGWIHKVVPRAPMEFDIPQEATQSGELTLRWRREPGRGGNGTGCDLSEIWLIKV